MADDFLKEMLQDIREDVKDVRTSHSKQSEAMYKLEKKVEDLTNLMGFQKKKDCYTFLEPRLQGVRLHRGH